MSRIRLLIADDHPVVRAGLRSMLEAEDDLEVVAEVGDGEAAIERVRQLAPDVVLMDLQMPKLDGASAAARLRRDHPDIKVLVITTYDTDADVLRAVEAGAVGYLLKDAPREQLLAAIRAAASGRSALAASVATRLVARVADGARGPILTGREIEILGLVARGRRNKEIARELKISEATVKTHLIHIFEKLDATDRTSAVTAAVERGILRLGGD